MVNRKKIGILLFCSVLLAVLTYALLYEIYFVKKNLAIILLSIAIVSDLVVFVRTFWGITTNSK
jgi:hypothetical protein